MAVTIEEVAIIVSVIITAIYVIVTALILFESRKQRDQNVKSTKAILQAGRLQRLQDAEFKTAPTQVRLNLTERKDIIGADISGGRSTLSHNFTI